MKTPYDWLAQIYTNCSGHITKMATTPRPYMVKTLKISSSLEPKGQRPWDLVCSVGMWALPDLHK